ncbi:hypothetical protein [Novipirellula artificiosorum]|uniref:Uncharacterized protein n=1 Tax=Novipirellula artificiosorum TaxID=2528016 RepID=A0A5C6DZ97_9BACT|nr:hypothetical protein [Novipirellula artificiosorum]TWU41117.1 hypothetical protein Poly41_19550 [Novipirellula artificiosorum]
MIDRVDAEFTFFRILMTMPQRYRLLATLIAPIDRANLGPAASYRYRYWLLVGDASALAENLDALWDRHRSALPQQEPVDP